MDNEHDFTAMDRDEYIISHIDEAAASGAIKVFYQPVYSVLSRSVYSFEALARWDDPVLGFLSPADFIPILEDERLIYKLTLAVLESVCAEIERRAAEGRSFFVSVNISRSDFFVADLHERINEVLRRHNVVPSSIALEITETALYGHEDDIRRHIEEFHRDGFSVWLDDFGSGYSSLNTLQHFDFDLLKIDMQFLRNPTERTEAIIQEIVDMSKRLGMKCITEGVETKRQLDFLTDIGCFYVQGFYISRPVPIDDLSSTMLLKGIGIETMDDHRFFGDISLVNVMLKTDPYIGKGFEQAASPTIVTVVMRDRDGSFRTLYVNGAGRKWLADRGVATEAEVNRRNAEDKSEIYDTMRRSVEALSTKGEAIEEHFRDPHFPGKIRIQLITAYGGRKAVLTTARRDDNIASDFKFEDLASGTPGAVMIVNAHGEERILFANSEAMKVFGCRDMDDLLAFTNGSFHALIAANERERADRSIWKQMNDPASGRRAYVVAHAVMRGGGVKILLTSARLIHHKSYGDVFFIILQDLETMSRLFADANRLSVEAVPRMMSGDDESYIVENYRSAMSEGLIRLGYRMLSDQLSGKIAAVEAVPEWNDPERGKIGHAILFGALEGSPLIRELCLHVVGVVAREMARLMREGFNCVPTFVEVPPRTLADHEFHEKMNDVMMKNAIPRRMIIVKCHWVDIMRTPALSRHAIASYHEDGYLTAARFQEDATASIPSIFMGDFAIDCAIMPLSDATIKSEKARVFIKNMTSSLLTIGVTPIVDGIVESESRAFMKSVGCYIAEEPGVFYSDAEIARSYAHDEFETTDEFNFYRDIGRVNVLDYQRSVKGDAKEYAISVAIFMTREGEIRTLYLSENTREWFPAVGATAEDGANWLEAHGRDESLINMWNAQAELKNVGDVTTYYFATQKSHWTIKLKLIAVSGDGEMRAFIANTAVVGKQNDRWLARFAPTRDDIRRMVLAGIDGANLSMFWKNEKREFIGANRRFLRYYGLRLNDIVGKKSADLGIVIDRAKYDELEENAIRYGKPVKEPISLKVGGKMRHVLFYETPVFSKGHVVGLFGILSDVTFIKEKLQLLESAAQRDALTGLRNRRALEADLDHIAGHRLFVMMLDVDHFKRFNDAYGHRYGDQVLRITSRALDHAYSLARCYRYGGDEFTVIGTYTDMTELKQYEKTFRDSLKARQISDITLDIETSCGVALGSPQTRDDTDALMIEADRLLYEAKERGRNVTVYGEE